MKNVLVIGGAGYVGSRLRQVLSEKYVVDSVDCCWFNFDKNSIIKDYDKLTIDDLSHYSVVILLAGHSSVKTCAGDIKSPWLNNVTNFINLVDKLKHHQLLIYASSASVYGNSEPGQLHSENIKQFIPVNNYDITKYTLDLHAQLAIQEGRKIIGLRFGTVNGWSPNLRTDVMINSMYANAEYYKEIVVTNKHISRAILGIEDLCRAVDACIEQQHIGIYNLASFNTTVEEIAAAVSKKLGVLITDKGRTPNVYDFGIDTRLFEHTYNFKFQETPETIVDGLIARYKESHLERRDDYLIYNWEKHVER